MQLPAETTSKLSEEMQSDNNQSKPSIDTDISKDSKVAIDYLRNSMAQERLKGLALLCIEAARAKVMDMGGTYRQICRNDSKEKKIV
jgi:hypothetical protein